MKAFLNTDTLTKEDVENLFSYLGISNEVLQRITRLLSHKEALPSNITYETDVFKAWYSSIDDTELEKCHNDIDIVYNSCKAIQASGNKSKLVFRSNDKSPSTTEIVYKNLINNTINVLGVELVYLKELQRLSSITYSTDITKHVLESVNKKGGNSKCYSRVAKLDRYSFRTDW